MIRCLSINTNSVVGIPEVVRTLQPYLMQKNLFEFFSLTDSGDAKTSGTCTIARARAIL